MGPFYDERKEGIAAEIEYQTAALKDYVADVKDAEKTLTKARGEARQQEKEEAKAQRRAEQDANAERKIEARDLREEEKQDQIAKIQRVTVLSELAQTVATAGSAIGKKFQDAAAQVDTLIARGYTYQPKHLVILTHDRMFHKSQDSLALVQFIQLVKRNPNYVFETVDHYPGLKK